MGIDQRGGELDRGSDMHLTCRSLQDGKVPDRVGVMPGLWADQGSPVGGDARRCGWSEVACRGLRFPIPSRVPEKGESLSLKSPRGSAKWTSDSPSDDRCRRWSSELGG